MHIEKKDTLGISIAAACQGGVIVSSVTEGSPAAKAGLKYGDQLLEVSNTCVLFSSFVSMIVWFVRVDN